METRDEPPTDTDLILDAVAAFGRGLDTLRVVALRCHTRDRKTENMRLARQQAQRKETAPVLQTPEPLGHTG